MRIISSITLILCTLVPTFAFAGECVKDGARAPFTLDDQRSASVPGIEHARFFGDDSAAFLKAMPDKPGAWLAISGGGSDGAYSAGLLNGWSKRGDRPEFSVITGISTGATIAPFAFLGADYDAVLRENFTSINAGDIFEDFYTDLSLLDTWPLKDLIARQATPDILKAVAREHERGRRLYVVTMNLDSEQRVVWDMGAIANKGNEAALALFRNVILASSAIPGLFPPVYIDLDKDGRCIREVHIDGSAGGAFYLAPKDWLEGWADYRLPSSSLHVMMNGKTQPHFEMAQPNVLSLLGRAIAITLKLTGRVDIERVAKAAAREHIPYTFSYIPNDFTDISRGAFDGEYMKALFARGERDMLDGSALNEGAASCQALRTK